MPNALAQETSPYLRQHAENPVDWLPWGPEALARARAEDRPLLVSIGYSACHWCHVMERESFEDPRTAAVMNESFVCVKVDREERPDVDALYMEAVQGMTGHGGWPLHVFLTPERPLIVPGSSLLPRRPAGRGGDADVTRVLQAIAESWEHNREEIRAGGERLRERLSGGAQLSPSAEPPHERALDQAVATLAESFDSRNGGFGTAPKFPQAPVLELLLLRGDGRTMALTTLHAMAGGGIHDQLGGGFARYSVDAAWTVPHFEKMLYDNALLARAYLHGWQRSKDARLRAVCVDTLEWALREMRGPEGGFYSALDADSEGVEGRFYVWTVAELREILGEDADAAIAWFGAAEQGNFQDPHHPEPGLNVLTDRGDGGGQALDRETRERIRARLLEAREQHVRPALDDKRLTSWNALMISALAEAGAALSEPRYLDAAVACARVPARPDERRSRPSLAHVQRRPGQDRRLPGGSRRVPAGGADRAVRSHMRGALVPRGASARRRDDRALRRSRQGRLLLAAADGEALIVRRKDLEDSPIPSGSSSAAVGLLRLAQLTGSEEYERRALGALALAAEIAPRHPTAFGHMLQAMHWHLAPARPIACAVPFSE